MALASTSDVRMVLGMSAPRSLSLCTPRLGSSPRPRRTLAPAGRSRRVCRAEEGSLSDLVKRRQQQGEESGSGETAKRSGGKQQGKGKRSGSVSSGGGIAEAKGRGDGGRGLENGGDDGDEDSGVKVVSVKKGGGERKAVFEDVGNIYDNPEIYDMAFSFRDMEKEADFLYDSYEKLKGGATPSVFLELGCGPAAHSMEMADSGLQVYAVDNNAAMLEYARAEWNAVGEVLEEAGDDDLPSMSIVEADMRTYALPEGVRADMCGILCGTFNHLLTLEDAQCCLRSCHRNLTEGGLLVIEMVHPDLLFDGSAVGQGDTWQLELEDGVQVEMWYGSEQDRFDALTQVLDRNVVVEVNRQGKLQRAHSTVHQRQYCLGELELLADICGFKVVAGFGEMDLQVPLRNDDPNYMVLVLERLPDRS